MNPSLGAVPGTCATALGLGWNPLTPPAPIPAPSAAPQASSRCLWPHVTSGSTRWGHQPEVSQASDLRSPLCTFQAQSFVLGPGFLN